MKVLMFSDTYGSVTTTFIRNEVGYFNEKHELAYVADKLTGDPGLVRVIILPFEENIFSRKINWYLWKLDWNCSFRNSEYAQRLNELILQEKPDIIHCHFAYEALKLLQNIDPAIRVPILVHFHGYDASQMLLKRSYVNALRQCLERKGVFPIVVSDKMKSDLGRAGLPVSSAEILRYGIDLKAFNPRSDVQKERIFLQISSLLEKKGHKYTLQAFSLFLRQRPEMAEHVKLVVAGEGELKDELIELARSLNLSQVVSFVGKVNKEEAVHLLDKASFFVHHSVTAENGDQEGIPNAIMEAMAMKLPILSTYHAGIPELVQHGVNGLLCQERDIETYAWQIEEILSWNKLDVNRKVIEENYNLEKHNQQLERIYESKKNFFL